MFFLLGEVTLAEIHIASLHLRQELGRCLDSSIVAPVHLVGIAGKLLRMARHAIPVDELLSRLGVARAKWRGLHLRVGRADDGEQSGDE